MAVRPLPPDPGARLTRARTRAVAVGLAIAIAGGVCLTFGARADIEPAAAAAPSVAPLSTPLWSPRRVPAVFGAAIAASQLRQQLPAIAAPYANCVAVDDTNGAVARLDADLALAGASTQKLMVAAAGLAVMGARFRFATRAVTVAPLRAGELDGDLTIVGSGDPMLTTADAPRTAQEPSTRLSDLADAIVRAGVRRITGALVADDSRYDRQRAVPDWKSSEAAEGDVGALGALVVDGGYGDTGLADPDPAGRSVRALATLLAARGVQITGGAIDPGRAAPAAAREIARVASAPLADVVKQMLSVSNNETAELLTRELGVRRGGAGTTLAGTRAIPSVLARLRVPVAGVVLHDGSGLAPDDRVTCRALLRVLALGSQPRFSPIRDGLAVAGRSGTLAGRFVGTTLAGRLRAKTGHIEGVVGLAGLVDTSVRFAFLANGDFSTVTGEILQDRIAESIGQYADTPGPPDLPVP